MAGAYATFKHMTDYIGFEGLLTEEEVAVREAARDFVNAEVLPIIEKHAQDQTFPSHLIPMMGDRDSLPSPTACSCTSWSAATAASAPSPPCRARS